MSLRDLLGDKIYEQQKKLFAEIVEGGKKVIKKRADEIYIVQKEVLKEAQAKLFEAAQETARELYNSKFDILCDQVRARIPFVGGFLSRILKKYKSDILEAIL